MTRLVSGASQFPITCIGVQHQHLMAMAKSCKEKWKMLPLHIQNIHVNGESGVYPECGHGNLEGDAADRLWLQPGRVMAINI